MKPVSDFFPRLLPYLPGCSEPLAQQALVDAAIAFCEDSQAVRETLEPVAAKAGVAQYELEAPSQQQVARVLSVSIDGVELSGVFAEDVAALGDAPVSRPTVFFTTRNGSEFLLNVFPVPDKAYTLKVHAALRPVRGATQFEDDLMGLWSDAVLAGAMSRIMAIPNQPFSDIQVAAAYGSSAAAQAKRARVEGNVGRVRGSIAVRHRPFA